MSRTLLPRSSSGMRISISLRGDSSRPAVVMPLPRSIRWNHSMAAAPACNCSGVMAGRAGMALSALALDPVLGRFLGDDDVVGVGLLEARRGDAHETSPLPELHDGGAAREPHPRAQPAHQLRELCGK